MLEGLGNPGTRLMLPGYDPVIIHCPGSEDSDPGEGLLLRPRQAPALGTGACFSRPFSMFRLEIVAKPRVTQGKPETNQATPGKSDFFVHIVD